MSKNTSSGQTRSLLAAVLAAIAASSCCAGPFVLLSLGIGGSWISNLSLLEPLRPFFIITTLVFLALAFRKLYQSSPQCAANTPCAKMTNPRRLGIGVWLTSVSALLIMSFPWYGPYLLD